jgi:8-oxo-dGTP pyrophosphatase MutT (NUDIX family)
MRWAAEGPLFDGYADSFEQVRRLSRPAPARQPRNEEPVARREYYNDPRAPTPNSLVVATAAVVTEDAGRILLQRRADSGNWALPGGGMEMSESLTDSVIREVKEETGLEIEVTGLVGTYTDPRHIIAYAGRGPPPVQHLLHRPHHRRHARDQQRVH